MTDRASAEGLRAAAQEYFEATLPILNGYPLTDHEQRNAYQRLREANQQLRMFLNLASPEEREYCVICGSDQHHGDDHHAEGDAQLRRCEESERRLRLLDVDRGVLERALAAANDQCVRYWCWRREDYERADALRCELSALLGEPREPRGWPE